jgi:pimeloyl-ACP methyl ester carboxylesterase
VGEAPTRVGAAVLSRQKTAERRPTTNPCSLAMHLHCQRAGSASWKGVVSKRPFALANAGAVVVLGTSPMPTRAEELREAVRLAVDATLGVTDVVQKLHHTLGGGPEVLGRPLEGIVKLLSAPAYAGVKLVTNLVGAGLDAVLEQLGPVLGPGGDSAEQDLVVGALNGVVGDILAERGSTLAITTEFRRAGKPVVLGELGPVTGKLLVLVHGSSATDASWSRKGAHHGEALEKEQALGLTWVALRYNSGRHVSTNGHEFTNALQALVTSWPVPVTDVTIVAHSMGGLVTRSACQLAEEQGLPWRQLLRTIVFLGTPHQGAPLERAGNVVGTLLGLSRYSAPLTALAQLRSAGVTDLRFGLTRADEWQGVDRFAHEADPRKSAALPDGVTCFTIAATTSREVTPAAPGDGLVPVDSALGRHERPELSLAFEPSRQLVLPGLNHQELLSDERVGAQLRAWLGARA